MERQARTVATSPAESPAFTYLPGLDGLRALSVLAVLAYHANSSWLPGGFLGVEVFFVISGFIITRGLILEWQHAGRISVPSFWRRRGRRLLPALSLLLIGVLAYTAIFDSGALAKLRIDVLYALGYVTNWHLIFSNQSYFDSWSHPSFLRHLWSLAIEEQFYVIWPLVLFAALKVFRAGGACVLILLGVVTSYTAMSLMAGGRDPVDMSRVYYGTDTRIGALLIGSAAGFLPLAPRLLDWLSRSRLVSLLGAVALGQLLLLGWKLNDTDAFLYHGGFLMTTLLAATLIISFNNPKATSTRLLSLKPLRWVGVRSYGIYLYHWPILLLTWPDTTASTATFALQVVGTLVLADLSYRFIELPVRRGVLGRLYAALGEPQASWRRSFASGFATAAALGVVAVLAFVAIRAQAPAVPPYLATTELRLVSPSTAEDVSSQISTLSPVPSEQEQPPAEVPTEEAPPPAGTPGSQLVTLPDQCAVIRGRAYESEEERTWFLQNCVRQQPAPQGNGQPLPAFVATGTISVDGGISAIGDSVMVGAGGWLAATFAGIDIDAAVGRQVYQAVAMLRDRAAEGTLARNVVLHLGNNGTFTSSQFDQIMEAVGPERRVYFINLHVPRSWEGENNTVIASGVGRYGNAYLIDWHGVVSGHDELFAADGVHIAAAGARIYTGLVLDAITR